MAQNLGSDEAKLLNYKITSNSIMNMIESLFENKFYDSIKVYLKLFLPLENKLVHEKGTTKFLNILLELKDRELIDNTIEYNMDQFNLKKKKKFYLKVADLLVNENEMGKNIKRALDLYIMAYKIEENQNEYERIKMKITEVCEKENECVF